MCRSLHPWYGTLLYVVQAFSNLFCITPTPSDCLAYADAALDEPPRLRDGPIITPTVAKSILGQAALQLGVMAALLGPLGTTLVAAGGGPVAAGLDPGDHTCQYTLVFNSFVMMQLFNQVWMWVRSRVGAGAMLPTLLNMPKCTPHLGAA